MIMLPRLLIFVIFFHCPLFCFTLLCTILVPFLSPSFRSTLLSSSHLRYIRAIFFWHLHWSVWMTGEKMWIQEELALSSIRKLPSVFDSRTSLMEIGRSKRWLVCTGLLYYSEKQTVWLPKGSIRLSMKGELQVNILLVLKAKVFHQFITQQTCSPSSV